MAVQDDNTILKKADLKAYHEQIAGQLGGTFALRTNNGDYYSTDEKVVGVWTDGRPLYQKNYTGTFPNWSSGAIAVANVSIADLNVNECWVFDTHVTNAGFPKYSGSTMWNGGVSAGGNCIRISTDLKNIELLNSNNNWNGVNATITIRYTKTTDTANSAITSGAYDINFPNTWPANTEVFLGNGVYGYRATGNMIAIAKGKANQINTTIAPSRLIGCGGSMTVTNIENKTVSRMLGQSVAWVGENTRNTWRSSAVINSNNVLAFLFDSPDPNYGDISSTSDTYDFWVTYTKGGN